MASARASLFLLPWLAAIGCGGDPFAGKPTVQPSSSELPSVPEPDSAAAKCLQTAAAKHTPRPNAPPKIAARHVLVRYAGAKLATETITRTREAACLRALEARDKLRAGADFGEVVKEYSEEPGAASRGGAIGAFERSNVVAPFGEAAFELEPKQLSDIVETEFGFHIIQRTE